MVNNKHALREIPNADLGVVKYHAFGPAGFITRAICKVARV